MPDASLPEIRRSKTARRATRAARVHNLAAELRPGALDHLGLAAALSQRARQFQRRSGVACTPDVAEPLPALPAAVADERFHIFQEALTNVARHAQATQVQSCAAPS